MARPKKGTTFWGRVWPLTEKNINGCIVFNGCRNHDGYGRINKDGKLVFIHREVWVESNGDIPEGMCICHKCDNPSCLNIEHLFIGTHDDNMADKREKGRCAKLKGSSNGASKLNEDQVIDIKRRLKDGQSKASIGRLYGVTDSNIRLIAQGKKWKHVKEVA